MSDYTEEINRRRTFAIISHPDAGKTTLTEKFLLYGGAINLAGSVKGKATARHAVSDWMQIEKERGISVTSSVLQFEYDGYCINILDTPGHQDFSEDTYRTLMAADSAVMVIDASKGVEAQTRKLFKVCVMRKIPIFTFINKMDRDANDTFELLDDIEKELGIATCPVNWPIGSGKAFKGVYDREKKCVISYSDTEKGTKEGTATEIPVENEEKLRQMIGDEAADKLLEEIELLDGAIQLHDGTIELYDGVIKLTDGTFTFRDQTSHLDQDLQDQLSDAVQNMLSGDFPVCSFVSPLNTNVDSVQFVMSTTPIEENQISEAEPESEPVLSFWQKILRLFGLY